MQPQWLLRKGTSIATIVIHSRGQVAALTLRTNGAQHMNFLTIMSAGVFAVLGTLHLVYTLHDFGERPRYFRPADRSLLPAMRKTTTAIGPTGRDYWSGILGFNLSHSIGVLLFALLIVVTAQYQISWLKPILALVGGAFAARADSGSRWQSLRRDFLAVLVSCPHALEFNRYRTHGSGLGSLARRRLRSRKDTSRPRSIGRL
jgi:hypothetical protein